MYSLLVSSEVRERTQGTFNISRNRFLEYTSERIAAQLRPLSIEGRACIKSWPSILMEEGRSQEHAYVTQITGVELARTEIKLTISSLPADSTILNDALWKLRTDLDIDQFEFNRNHCAIKERDLFQILGANGHSFDPSVVSRFKEMPLPAPSRSALISARDCISKWSHTDIDDFLLEAGISGLAAGRDVGGRQNRAIAILKFAIENPSATTAENSLFSVFLVRRTKSQLVDAQSRDATITDKVTIESPRRNEDRESSGRSPNRVFVVHGQNERARSAVVSFLTKVGLQGIVLHEQPNMGRHLLTKFIEEAELTTFAIVLMTDDDVGGLKGDALLPRARQNVILELGYFLSHFGQRKVCALITPGLETPSDFDGIVYISMEGGGKWEAELRRELEAAGMPLIDVV